MTPKHSLWQEPADDPARPRATDPRIRGLLRQLGHDDAWPVKDLGGTMSLNVHVPAMGAVLRIHQPFESRRRVVALRELHRWLARSGFVVGAPLPFAGREVVRWEGRWAEIEAHVAHSKPAATWESYRWMYAEIGRLHAHLRGSSLVLPRPVLATYGPPSTLRRWIAVTAAAVEHDEKAKPLAAWCRELIAAMARQWRPTSVLPTRIIHGDIRLGNIVRTASGDTAYLDFGFSARRPRVHELAYSLVWMILRPDSSGTGADFDWAGVPELVDAYERNAGERLTDDERRCLGAYVASVPLYMGAISGFTANPVAHLVENEPFIRIADWVLAHPPALT